MGRIDELMSRQFAAWEVRGRGWKVWPHPTAPEPPFRRFDGYRFPRPTAGGDDGRKPSPLASLFDRIHKRLNPDAGPEPEQEIVEPEAASFERTGAAALLVSLPKDFDAPQESLAPVLSGLSRCGGPISFELVGVHDSVCAQFAATERDAAHLQRSLQARFPQGVFARQIDRLDEAWSSAAPKWQALVEYGLAREFFIPLRRVQHDILVDVVAALSDVGEGEAAVYQIIFEPVKNDWAESILNAVYDREKKPVFANAPEFPTFARQKIASPLFAAVVRTAATSPDRGRAWDIAANLARALNSLSDPLGNELIPLSNDGYPLGSHRSDVRRRQCRRSGILLNERELLDLAHLPTRAVQNPKFVRQIRKTRTLPQALKKESGVLLGVNEHAGESAPVRVGADQRVRHMHVMGTPGTGKSTFLYQMIRQDLENGDGLAVFDPHGDLVERILGSIPEKRIDDVIVFDPADPQYSVGFNILSAQSDQEKNVLASDLVGVFERLSRNWGDQMNTVFRNAILAFLENTRPGNLGDLQRFLIEPGFRGEILRTATDPHVRYYWEKSFPLLTGNKSVGPIVTRLEEFLGQRQIRDIVLQRDSRLNFAEILAKRRIFLAKLSHGAFGHQNTHLLGSLLFAKFQQSGMARESLPESERPDFWIYIDEFQNFVTPSIAEMLTGVRKYRVGLTLAHQDFGKIKEAHEVESAVKSMPLVRVVFRVGDSEAKHVESSFGNFAAQDFKNLPDYHAHCRIQQNEFDFNMRVLAPAAIDERQAAETRNRVRSASNERYGARRGSRTESGDEAESKKAEPQQAAQDDASSRKDSSCEDEGLHERLKDQILEAALRHDYIAKRERKVHALGAEGRVDVELRRGKLWIACEVAHKNQTRDELGNIRHRLAAGFLHVAVICPAKTHLNAVRRAVEESLGEEDSRKVGLYSPAEFLKQLEEWATADPDGARGAQAGPQKQKINLSGQANPDQTEDDLRRLRERMKGR